MNELISPEALTAFFQVIFIDLVLAGDNAIVIGLAAAGLPREQRTRAILVGVGAATILRIIFAGIATWLLAIVGLLLAGGILLLWVCWKMWRELHAPADTEPGEDGANGGAPRKSFAQAAAQIVIADVSMSLDNVLAVAGAAREHPIVLVFGLALSVVLMGVAASFIARVLQRYRWIAFVGLAIILYVALKMIWDGAFEIRDAVALLPLWPWPDLITDIGVAEAVTSEPLQKSRVSLGALAAPFFPALQAA